MEITYKVIQELEYIFEKLRFFIGIWTRHQERYSQEPNDDC